MTPEDFWTNSGDNVIGMDVLRDGLQARQAETYQTIALWVVANKVTEVLDVGCNVAALAMFLRMNNYVGLYVGLDSNPHALKVARQEELAILGNLRDLPIDSTYMTVVVKDVIEHLESYLPLSGAFQMAGDYVIVATYLPWTNEPQHLERHPNGYYVNRYCLNDIVALATKCDFELMETVMTKETTGTDNMITFWKRIQG